MSSTLKALCATLAVALAGAYYFLAPAGAPLRRSPPAAAVDPITAKKLEIFDVAAKRPADPALVALYTAINARHFAGALPSIPVMWDDRLRELDVLVRDNYHLQGMTNGALMLVSRALEDDEAELQRTVCHEAVHVKLHEGSGAGANHGEAFQAELRRIFEEGCFVAILATEPEQAALKQWIDTETARLNAAKAQIDSDRDRIDAERAEIEAAIVDLNARTATANAQRSGWPGEDERQALATRRAQALQDSADFNAVLARHNADAAHLNREVDRYKLMLAYPRGVDEERMRRE